MQEIKIEANRAQKEYWVDLYRHRELFYFFTWRDIIVRYKQAFFGIAWALIKPLITIALFTFIFGKLANFPSEGIPYSLFALSGMLPWLLFSSSLSETTTALLNNPNLIAKVYFPRMILPVSQILVQMVDFGITLMLLFGLMAYWGVYSVATLWALPFLILLLVILSIGCGLLLSAVTVKYRDVRYIVPFIVQIGLYLSPVGYGSFMIPEKWQWLYFMNPVAGIIEGFRWALFGLNPPYLLQALLTSVAVTFILLFCGYKVFRKVERSFGDII